MKLKRLVFDLILVFAAISFGYSEPAWSLATPLGTAKGFASLVYGNGIFVAVTSKCSETSTDGIAWAEHRMPDGEWSSVAFGNGVFVAVSSQSAKGKSAAVSSDGMTWTAYNMSGDTKDEYEHDTIAFGNGVFVALPLHRSLDGKPRFASRSIDGVKWESAAFEDCELPSGQPLCYGNGVFVCCLLHVDYLLVSPDGLTWRHSNGTKQSFWNSISYGNGVFVAVASQQSPSVITSPDGLTWSPQPNLYKHFGFYTGHWSAVAFCDGIFVAIASPGKAAAYSSDGITWTEISRPDYAEMKSIAFGNGIIVAIGGQSSSGGYPNSVASVIKMASQSQTAPAASSNQASQTTKDPKERLKELKDLYDSGMITEKEYSDKKAEILSQM